ncbi:hypothetical protein LYZ86_23880, partial [Xanthomonas hortorum pv. cynarae]
GGYLRMAAVRDQRAGSWGLGMSAYTHHREGAARNFLVILAVLAASATCAVLCVQKFDVAQIRALIVALWPVSGLLSGAALALLYKLLADTASTGKLDRRQRYEIDKIVRGKVVRLWLLVAAVIAPLAFALLNAHLGVGNGKQFFIGAVGLSVASTLFFFLYVPATWLNVRDFNAELGPVNTNGPSD